jgi:hypothetical protein
MFLVIDPVAHQIALRLLDDVAHVNPDAELDPPFLGNEPSRAPHQLCRGQNAPIDEALG